MSVVTPLQALTLTDEQKSAVEKETYRWISQANQLFDISLETIAVKFDLSGRAAGMYCERGNGKLAEKWIRYNQAIFAKYFAENIATTVPHEVAHYVVSQQHTKRGWRQKKIRPHGPEWKSVMLEFGVEPRRTCDFDLDGVSQRNYQRFSYQCGCQTHQLTAIRHNRIVRDRQRYSCRKCGQLLELEGS